VAYLHSLSGTVPSATLQTEAFVRAIHDAFLVAAIVCIFAIFASMVRGPQAEEALAADSSG
jgi:hypothetical protein